MDRTGSLVSGRFLLEGFLGATGAGASVWRASEIGRPQGVAIKLVRATDRAAAGRFERGARLAMELAHPAIATVHEIGHFNEFRYLAMELLEGESLQARLKRDGRLPIDAAVEIALQVLDALVAAEERRIVHRDLKPGNIFITASEGDERPRVKLLDFGIAKRAGGAPTATYRPQSRPAAPDDITARHHICGTPEYMAPEQILGQRLTTSIDIYAVGVLLFRLLAGTTPFAGKTRFEVYDGHLTTAVPPLPAEIGVPHALEQLIRQALAKEPAERPESAKEFRDELARVSGVAVLSQLRDQTPSPVHAQPDVFPDDGRTLEDDTGALAAYGPDRRELVALIGLRSVDGPTIVFSAPTPPARRRRAPMAMGLVAVIVGAAVAFINL